MDFSRDRHWLGNSQAQPVELANLWNTTGQPKHFKGIVHICDLMPTLLGFAGATNRPKYMDGYDFGLAFRRGYSQGPRTEALLDLYTSDNFAFPESMRALVKGDMKLIEGIIRDPEQYSESSQDRMNSSDTSWTTFVGEKLIRVLDFAFGESPMQICRVLLAHYVFHSRLAKPQTQGFVPLIRLYNLSADPSESNNIAMHYPNIVSELLKKVRDRDIPYNTSLRKHAVLTFT